MITKWTGLVTGRSYTFAYYDTTTTPETLIAAAGGAAVEEGSTGVFNGDNTTTLNAYAGKIVRVRATPGNLDGFIEPSLGSQEVAADPSFIVGKKILTGIEADGSVWRATTNFLEQSPSGSSVSKLLLTTTIASLTSQTVFTLATGSADNEAYTNGLAVIRDSVTAVQKAFQPIAGYLGGSLRVTLEAAPAFTIAVGDTVDIFADKASANVTFSVPEQGNAPPSTAGNRLYAFTGETKTHTIDGLDTDYRAIALVVYIRNRVGTIVTTITDGDLIKTIDSISFTVDKSFHEASAEWNWSARLAASSQAVQLYGPYHVLYAAGQTT